MFLLQATELSIERAGHGGEHDDPQHPRGPVAGARHHHARAVQH